MENPVNYQYSPLMPQQFRLLRPIGSLNPRDLRFKTSHISREAAPSYTAVSYTWGDQQPTSTIRLDGKLFSVRPNLLSCLYYLSQAHHKAEVGWDWIWVDAICINQQDDREKSEQVGLMSRTYSDARMVSVWLGLVPVSKSTFIQNWDPSQEYFSIGRIDVLQDESFYWRDHLDDLLNRPYWSRFWVVQEFLRACEIHYYCSDHITDSEHLYDMLTFETGSYGMSAVTNLDNTARQYAAASLILARNVDMFPAQRSSLYSLLMRHRRAQCQDRRDRVFALLSLLEAEEHTLLSRFLPNYALDADQVVVVALAHLTKYHNSDFVTITVDSDDIFQALGLEGGREIRRRMLARAECLDYYDDWTSVDVARTMALREDFLRDYSTFNDNTGHVVDAEYFGRGSPSSADRRGSVFQTLVVIAFIVVILVLTDKYLGFKGV